MSLLALVLLAGGLLWLLLLLNNFVRARLLTSPMEENEARSTPRVNLGDHAGVRSIQGSRQHMEDTYQAAINLAGDDKNAFFGVFDGHGGARASDFTAEHLHTQILFGSNPHKWEEEPQAALEWGFKQLDYNWLMLATKNNWDDGTTAVTSLIHQGVLYVANVGDSRAVLSHQGKAVDMSHDHKPIREDEKARIEKLGGRIIHYGTWRVEGVLAVTRAIGDRRLKKYVSAVPEIKTRSIKDGDEYLILASDGVWDVLSSQAAVDVVCSAKDVHEAARRLTETAYKRGSMDNITSLVIDLRAFRIPNAPPSPDAIGMSSSSSGSPAALRLSSATSSPSKSD